jgi:predicted house-cleaning noncanonical NTP pyrophosphatase (MazG superfamily)
MKIYNKLVRDKIPNYIESQGGSCKTHIADANEFQQKLHEKLVEEATEFHDGPNIEELADLLEVFEAVKKLHGWTTADVEKVRLEKREKRGGFDQRIILEES